MPFNALSFVSAQQVSGVEMRAVAVTLRSDIRTALFNVLFSVYQRTHRMWSKLERVDPSDTACCKEGRKEESTVRGRKDEICNM